MFLQLSIFTSRMNLAKAQRIDSFKIMNNKVIFNLVSKLETVGIIRGFEIAEDNKLHVFMKYVSKNMPFVRIYLIGKSSRRAPITLNELVKLVDRNGSSIYILSTGYGFLTHSECLIKRCSGEIVLRIDL